MDHGGINNFVRSNLGMTLGQLYPQNNPLNLVPQASFGGVPSPAAITYDGRTFLHGADTVFDFTDTFSWIRGAHSFKFGIFAERARAAKGASGNFGGNFAFARDVNNPSIPTMPIPMPSSASMTRTPRTSPSRPPMNAI